MIGTIVGRQSSKPKHPVTPSPPSPHLYAQAYFLVYIILHYFIFKVRYKRKDLLAHELVTSFLCMRWNMFIKYLYYINLLSYIVLMLLLTLYVHVYYLCK